MQRKRLGDVEEMANAEITTEPNARICGEEDEECE